MESSTVLRRALWANIAFAEISALFAFFAGSWQPVGELTGGENILYGVDMLVLAGLATWAVLRKPMNRTLVRVVMALNILWLGYLVYRFETTSSLSALGTEMLLIDSVALVGILAAQWIGLRASNQPALAR